MINQRTWTSLVVSVALLTLGACSIESNTKMQMAEVNKSKSDYFRRLEATSGPSTASLKRYGLAEKLDRLVFVDGVMELGKSIDDISADPSTLPPIDYSVNFSRITGAYELAQNPSLKIFEHPITLTGATTHHRPATQRVTASGAPVISGWGAMTAWQGENLVHCNGALASWIVLKSSTLQLPLFFIYYDSLEIGGPVQLSIYGSITGRNDENANLGIFYLDAAATGRSYEIRLGELRSGYPVLNIIRKGPKFGVAATLIFSTITKQFEVAGGSEGSIE